MAATKARSTWPVGFVKASVGENATSMVPFFTSAPMNSKPRVAAARGTGARGDNSFGSGLLLTAHRYEGVTISTDSARRFGLWAA